MSYWTLALFLSEAVEASRCHFFEKSLQYPKIPYPNIPEPIFKPNLTCLSSSTENRNPIDCLQCLPDGICEEGEKGTSLKSFKYPFNYCVKGRVEQVVIRGRGSTQWNPRSNGYPTDDCKENTKLPGNPLGFDKLCVCYTDNCNSGEADRIFWLARPWMSDYNNCSAWFIVKTLFITLFWLL